MSSKLKRTLALALAGGSLAIGVPAALAASGGDAAPAAGGGASAPALIQDEQQPRDQARPDGDCPEHEGGGQGSSTEAPSI